jgi:uncharacterized coiled-coil DUF342 family protein
MAKKRTPALQTLIERGFKAVAEDINDLRKEMATKEDIAELKTDISEIRSELRDIKARLKEIESAIHIADLTEDIAYKAA